MKNGWSAGGIRRGLAILMALLVASHSIGGSRAVFSAENDAALGLARFSKSAPLFHKKRIRQPVKPLALNTRLLIPPWHRQQSRNLCMSR